MKPFIPIHFQEILLRLLAHALCAATERLFFKILLFLVATALRAISERLLKRRVSQAFNADSLLINKLPLSRKIYYIHNSTLKNIFKCHLQPTDKNYYLLIKIILLAIHYFSFTVFAC